MAHVVILGLVLTLVAGVVSFAALVRRVHARPSRLPRSIPTPLLLYNLWMAAWLVSQYLGFHLFPTMPRPVVRQIIGGSSVALAILALAWLRSHAVLIDQFLGSRASRMARRAVESFCWSLAAAHVVGWGLSLAGPSFEPWFGAIRVWSNRLLFPVALAASVVLLTGAPRQQDAGERRALSVLSWAYVALFASLSALVIVFAGFRLGSPTVLLSADLALELGYNVLTVVWVSRYADAFAVAAPSEADLARGFDALCDACKISAREREIVELICQGLTNQEIGDRLFISVGTVKDHNYTIFQKAGVRNRTELARLFTRPTDRRDQGKPTLRRVG